RSDMRKQFLAFLPGLAFILLCAGNALGAAVNVTTATGGSTISADTTSASGGTGAYTSLTGPVLAETAKGAISTGTIILNAPTGFQFATTANSVTATVTGGTSSQTLLLGTSPGSQTQTVTPSTTTITITVFSADPNNGNASTITWSGIKVRPTSGTPLASANITETGTSSFTYNTGSAANYGTLTEVAGAANKLVIQ